jgi:hypothetical protein
MATATAARVFAQLTRTPVTPGPPPAVHRTFDLPWGKVDLDLPIEETNRYAMALLCERSIGRLQAENLPLWFTNPVGMIKQGKGTWIRSLLNVEIVDVSPEWKPRELRITKLNGEVVVETMSFFTAHGIVRVTPDKSDTQMINLFIARNVGILTNMPSDHRLYNGPGKPNNIDLAPVEAFRITDPSQIRVGQIYGVTYTEDPRWPKPIREISSLTILPNDASELVIYTVMPEWEWSCAYKQQMGWIKPGS